MGDGTTIFGPQITLHPELQRHMSGLAQQSKGTTLGVGYLAMWQIQRPLTFLRYQPNGNYTWICNTVLNACIIKIFGRRSLRHRTEISPLWYSQHQTPSNGSSFYRWKQPMCETSSNLVQSSGFSSNKKPHDLILLKAVGWFSLQKREPSDPLLRIKISFLIFKHRLMWPDVSWPLLRTESCDALWHMTYVNSH